MNGPGTTALLRYLPVDAGGQRFGIPLDDIKAVFRVEQDSINNAIESVVDNNPTPIIDLSYLLKGVPHSGQRLHTVAVEGETGVHALMVDAVYPIRTVEASRQSALPEIIGPARYLFRWLVKESEQLVLILNVNHLTMHFASLLQDSANDH
jgi:chemotaxis protein histidine kinase CheA